MTVFVPDTANSPALDKWARDINDALSPLRPLRDREFDRADWEQHETELGDAHADD